MCVRVLYQPGCLLMMYPCAQVASLGLSGGQALAASTALTAVPSRKLEAMHPAYAVQLFAIPCNGLPAFPSCLSCWLPLQLYLRRYHLPAWTMSLCGHTGQGLAYSTAGRRDLMSPSFPDMVMDARSPSHSSLVCIISPTDTAAAAAAAAATVATAAVAVAVGLSPPTQSRAGDMEAREDEEDEEARIPLTQLAAFLFPLSIGPPNALRLLSGRTLAQSLCCVQT